MVAPIVAAAAPTVIKSATDDEGLLNKLFKVGILVMVLGGLVISFFILNLVIDVLDLVGGTFNFAISFLDIVLPGTGLASAVVAGVSGLINAFVFGGRR